MGYMVRWIKPKKITMTQCVQYHESGLPAISENMKFLKLGEAGNVIMKQ